MSMRSVRFLLNSVTGRHASRVRQTTIAGVPSLVAGPSGSAGLIFANACTDNGIDELAVSSLVGAFAGAGWHAVAPELPEVREGRITPETIDALVRIACELDGPIVLVGASTGGSLVIVAAADPRIAGRVERVSAIAPFADLTNVLRLVTTGHYAEVGALWPYRIEPRLRWAAERSLRAIASGPEAEALLANVEPERFNQLYGALSPAARAAIETLSPVRALPSVVAPVDVAADPADAFFPLAEARALARGGARVVITPALSHVRPHAGLGVARLVRFVDQMLVPKG